MQNPFYTNFFSDPFSAMPYQAGMSPPTFGGGGNLFGSGMGFDQRTLAYAGMARSGANPTHAERLRQMRMARMAENMDAQLFTSDRRSQALLRMVRDSLPTSERAAFDTMSQGNLGLLAGTLMNISPVAKWAGGSMRSLGFGAMAASSPGVQDFAARYGLGGGAAEALQYRTATALAQDLERHFTTDTGALRQSRTHGLDRDRMGEITAMLSDLGAFDTQGILRARQTSDGAVAALDTRTVNDIKGTLESTFRLVSTLEDLYGSIGDNELMSLASSISGVRFKSEKEVRDATRAIESVRASARAAGMDEKVALTSMAGLTAQYASLGMSSEAAGRFSATLMQGQNFGSLMDQYRSSGVNLEFGAYSSLRANTGLGISADDQGRWVTLLLHHAQRNNTPDSQVQEAIRFAAENDRNPAALRQYIRNNFNFDPAVRDHQLAAVGAGHAQRLGALTGGRLEAYGNYTQEIARRRSLAAAFRENPLAQGMAQDLADSRGISIRRAESELEGILTPILGGGVLSRRDVKRILDEGPGFFSTDAGRDMIGKEGTIYGQYDPREIEEIRRAWARGVSRFGEEGFRSRLRTVNEDIIANNPELALEGAAGVDRRRAAFSGRLRATELGRLGDTRMGNTGFLNSMMQTLLSGDANEEQTAMLRALANGSGLFSVDLSFNEALLGSQRLDKDGRPTGDVTQALGDELTRIRGNLWTLARATGSEEDLKNLTPNQLIEQMVNSLSDGRVDLNERYKSMSSRDRIRSAAYWTDAIRAVNAAGPEALAVYAEGQRGAGLRLGQTMTPGGMIVHGFDNADLQARKDNDDPLADLGDFFRRNTKVGMDEVQDRLNRGSAFMGIGGLDHKRRRLRSLEGSIYTKPHQLEEARRSFYLDPHYILATAAENMSGADDSERSKIRRETISTLRDLYEGFDDQLDRNAVRRRTQSALSRGFGMDDSAIDQFISNAFAESKQPTEELKEMMTPENLKALLGNMTMTGELKLNPNEEDFTVNLNFK